MTIFSAFFGQFKQYKTLLGGHGKARRTVTTKVVPQSSFIYSPVLNHF